MFYLHSFQIIIKYQIQEVCTIESPTLEHCNLRGSRSHWTRHLEASIATEEAGQHSICFIQLGEYIQSADLTTGLTYDLKYASQTAGVWEPSQSLVA